MVTLTVFVLFIIVNGNNVRLWRGRTENQRK